MSAVTTAPTASLNPEAPPKHLQKTWALLSKWDDETILNRAAQSIQDVLILDVIRWAKDKPKELAAEIRSQLFPAGTINPKYMKVAEMIYQDNPRLHIGDSMVLAVVLVRIAAQRVMFNRAQK